MIVPVHVGHTRILALGVVIIGLLSAGVAAVAGSVLAGTFLPHPAGGNLLLSRPDVARSAQWADRHRAATAVLLLAAGVGLLLVLLLRRSFSRRAVVLAASVVAPVMAVMTVVTRGVVEWDQLALRSVTVGSDISGYWSAAFGRDVLFVLVDQAEVSQGQYTFALVAHLAAPFIAGLALLVVAAVLLRTPAGEPVVAGGG